MNTYRTNAIVTKNDALISAEDLRKRSSEITVSNELFEEMLSKLMSKIQSTAGKGLYESVFVDIDNLYDWKVTSEINTRLSKQEEFHAAKLLGRKFKNLGYTVRVRKDGSSSNRPDIMVSWKPKFSYWLKEFMHGASEFVIACCVYILRPFYK